MTVHAYVDDDHCYHCRLRGKNLMLAPSATPSRHNDVPPTRAEPRWEKGVAGERRPDGSFMPFLTPDRAPMPIKQFGENRRTVEAAVANLKTRQSPLTLERDKPPKE